MMTGDPEAWTSTPTTHEIEWTHPRTGEHRRVRMLGVVMSGASLLIVGAQDDGSIRAFRAEECRLP